MQDRVTLTIQAADDGENWWLWVFATTREYGMCVEMSRGRVAWHALGQTKTVSLFLMAMRLCQSSWR